MAHPHKPAPRHPQQTRDRHQKNRVGVEIDANHPQLFDDEITYRDEVRPVLPTEDQITASWNLIEKHSLNSTDATLLQCALDKASELRANGDNLVIVSSDKRLLRVSQSEGLITFDLKTDSQTTLDVFINSP